MTKTAEKKQVSENANQYNVWKHIKRIFDTEGSQAAVKELQEITGESDQLFLANQIFTHCL
jgi:retron-type reverse transcriptase